MPEIPARKSKSWIEYLMNIEAALRAVEDLQPLVPHSLWRQVWLARCDAIAMRSSLLGYVVSDVQAEPLPAPLPLAAE